MADGTTMAEANDIGDFEASPYWSNSWWETQDPQWDATGYLYRPGYWKWVPENDGWYSIDSLNSESDFASGSAVFYVQVVDATGGWISGGWDQITAEVTAGSTYYVVITCRYIIDAIYSARVSAVGAWSDWITPDPVHFDNVTGIEYVGFQQSYQITQGFGGDIPPDVFDAWSCVWHWARRGNFPGQYWTPDYNGTVGGDGVTGWGGADGVCKMPLDMPDRSPLSPKSNFVGWRLDSSYGSAFSPASLHAEVHGRAWLIDHPEPKTNEQLVPWPVEAVDREFEAAAPTDPAAVAEMQVVLTETPSSDTRSMVKAEYPAWGEPLPPGFSYPDWGLGTYNDVDNKHARFYGSFFGPEERGDWTEYLSGTTYEIDITSFNASKVKAATYGSLPTDERWGWALYVIPRDSLSDTVPTAMVTPESVAKDTVRDVQLNATYQPARYRIVVVGPPDLQPPTLSAPPCQIYPRDDGLGAGSAAVYPPPSSYRPGAYY